MTDQPGGRPDGCAVLFEPGYVDYADADVLGTLDPPPPELVHRIHLVARPAPGLVTVCASVEGWRFLPGGRLEPGEDLVAAADRELAEEAGEQLAGAPQVFYSQVARSRRPEPYRPGVPHPVMWWVFAVAPTRVIGEPTVADGEQITEVHRLPVDAAVDWLAGHDPICAAVLRLARHLDLV